MKKPVLAYKNLPPQYHLTGYCVVWLMLDRLAAAGWIWGVAGTVVALDLIGTFVRMFRVRQVELPEGKE